MEPTPPVPDSSLVPGPAGAMTPELLERMRTIGLRLDRSGTFWHADSEVSHDRLRQALLRWLDVLEDGRDIVRLDDKRFAYVEIEDAHLRARSARWVGDRCHVLWDDDQEHELDYAELRQAPDHALYTQVARPTGPDAPARRPLRGRIAGPAYHAIAERIIEVPGAAFCLEAAGQRWPVADAE